MPTAKTAEPGNAPGFDTKQRRKFLGFQRASGIYYPEFRLQLPAAPFEEVVIPYWAVCVGAGIIPTCFLAKRILHVKKARRQPPAGPSPGTEAS